MKTILPFFIILSSLLSIACSGEATINGKNNRAASTTMRKVKHYLPRDQQLEFEIAYWTTRDAVQDNRVFLDTVDGKTAAEIIEIGKKYFSERKAAGVPSYTKYDSWSDMLAKVSEERAATAMPKERLTEKDKKNNVLYKLSNL